MSFLVGLTGRNKSVYFKWVVTKNGRAPNGGKYEYLAIYTFLGTGENSILTTRGTIILSQSLENCFKQIMFKCRSQSTVLKTFLNRSCLNVDHRAQTWFKVLKDKSKTDLNNVFALNLKQDRLRTVSRLCWTSRVETEDVQGVC